MLRKPHRPVSQTIGKLYLLDAFLIDSPDRFATRIRSFQLIKNAQFQINDLLSVAPASVPVLASLPIDSSANASLSAVNNRRLYILQLAQAERRCTNLSEIVQRRERRMIRMESLSMRAGTPAPLSCDGPESSGAGVPTRTTQSGESLS